MANDLIPIGDVAARVCRRATRRRQLLDHLRRVGGVRTLSELLAETGRREAARLRADLDALEDAGLVWRRDMIWAPRGTTITETCWWAPRAPFPARQEATKWRWMR